MTAMRQWDRNLTRKGRINEARAAATKIPSLLHSATSHCSRVALPLCALCRRSQRRRCYCIDFAFPGACFLPSLPLQQSQTRHWSSRSCLPFQRLPAGGSIIFDRTWFHLLSSLSAGLVLIAFVVANLLRFVLRAPSVTTEVLCASISAYLMLGLMWTMAYWLVDQLTPGGAFSFNTKAGKQSMNGFNAFYFSFITLEHGRLRRHHAGLKNCALACGHGSDDRLALCGSPDCPPGFTLFESKIR